MKHKIFSTSILAILLGCYSLQAQEPESFRTTFPSALSVAHTWNRSLAKKAGQMVGEQMRKEGITETTAPNLTVIKPGDTRNLLPFYGESPYLTAETGVEMGKGLQNKGQLKAFICFDKKEVSAPYVRPFERVLTEAHAAGIATNEQIKGTTTFGQTSANVSDEFKKTALQVAHESIVLLKNAGNVLPVDTAWVKHVAVSGDTDLATCMTNCLKTTLPCTVTQTDKTENAAQADLILVFEDDVIDQERIKELMLSGRPVVLILLNSRPVALKEAGKAAAIIEAWHPGQQGIQALADVLSGTYNPGGKLAVTFPDYAFGHGLSYTDFSYSNLRIEPSSITPEGSVTVRFNVTNTGQRAGAEVVQVYLEDEKSSVPLQSPKLEACKRTNIQPGQTKEVKFTIRHRNMVLLDKTGKWTVEPGFFTVRVGSGSCDIRLQSRFEVK